MEFYDSIIKFKEGEVKCVLCDEIIPDSSDLIESHVNEDKHKGSFLLQMMIQNNIVSRESCYYCFICNLKVLNDASLICHLKTLSHTGIMDNIKKLIKDDGDYLVLPKRQNKTFDIYCNLCDCFVPFSLEATTQHILKDVQHKYLKAMTVQPHNGIFSVENCNDKLLYCKLCDKYFENYIEMLFEHINEKDHSENINKILMLIEKQHIDIENYLTDPKQDKVFCYLCKSNVPCKIINLDDHVNGSKHTKFMDEFKQNQNYFFV